MSNSVQLPPQRLGSQSEHRDRSNVRRDELHIFGISNVVQCILEHRSHRGMIVEHGDEKGHLKGSQGDTNHFNPSMDKLQMID